MRKTGIYKFIIFNILCLLNSFAIASEYYLIEDIGPTYPDFYIKANRVKYMEDLWGKVLPKSVKSRSLSNNDSPYYSPTKGDVGILIYDLGVKEDRVILDVSGNFVLIGKKGISKVTKNDYDNFINTSNSALSKIFDFKLGVTTFDDAKDILKKNGADFNSELGYYGYLDLPIISINRYKYIPLINNLAPRIAELRFIDNKLYQIVYRWYPKSDSFADVNEFKSVKIAETITNVIKDKYNRNPLTIYPKGNDNIYIEQFWINPNRHIILRNFNWTRADLEYNDSSLLVKAEALMKVIDNEVEEKTKNKTMEEIKSQL